MRFVITGGSGFIGSHLIRYLKRNTIAEVKNVDLTLGHDLTKIETMRKVLKGTDVVFHLATLPLELSLKFPYLVALDLYQSTLVLCELCRQKVFKTLIQVSSSEVYGTSEDLTMKETHPLSVRTIYASGKASADLTLRAYGISFGINYSIVRPFNNYGPGQLFAKGGVIAKTIYRIITGKRPLIYGNGSAQRDFIYVGDTVRGIYEVYKNKNTRGQIVHLATGESYSMEEVVRLICKLIGKKFNPIYKPERIADVKLHIADITKMKELLNFEPKVSFCDGLRRTIKWAKKEYC